MRKKRLQKGVTLVELLIVVLILAALSTIAIPRITQSAQNAKQNACDTNISIMNSAIEMYAADFNGEYPSDTEAFKKDVLSNMTYFPDGPPTCPLGGTYTMNPTTKRVTCDH